MQFTQYCEMLAGYFPSTEAYRQQKCYLGIGQHRMREEHDAQLNDQWTREPLHLQRQSQEEADYYR